MNPPCDFRHHDTDIEVIVLVASNAKNFRLRQAQRSAFDEATLRSLFRIKRFFLLASDKRVDQRKIEAEYSKHRDIVQGNFQEDYAMLSYKHIMGLQWVSQQCKTNLDR